ncbi:hypothetical protein BKA69DRAFT_1062648 [Paraphysoderma sedebokerense]|nr:hypothetical protein BKA69DRAFT_1062648 [Paraphysoderma sedebokerense]
MQSLPLSRSISHPHESLPNPQALLSDIVTQIHATNISDYTAVLSIVKQLNTLILSILHDDHCQVFLSGNLDTSPHSPPCLSTRRPDPTLNLDSIKSLTLKWLVRILHIASQTSDSSAGENDNDNNAFVVDELIETVASVISNLCGRAACGSVTKSFAFPTQTLKIQEPSFVEADVGCQTWGSGIVFSSLILAGQIRFDPGDSVLELGSGVGISGLAAALCSSPPSQLILSDYNTKLLHQLSTNVKLNGLPQPLVYRFDSPEAHWIHCNDSPIDHHPPHNTPIKGPDISIFELNWSWFTNSSFLHDLSTHHQTPSEEKTMLNIPLQHPHHLDLMATPNSFDKIIASDVIYDASSPVQVSSVIATYLSRPSQTDSPHSENVPTCILVLPVRPKYEFELSNFELEMSRFFKCVMKQLVLWDEHETVQRYFVYQWTWK